MIVTEESLEGAGEVTSTPAPAPPAPAPPAPATTLSSEGPVEETKAMPA